jgi:hypothetical protein
MKAVETTGTIDKEHRLHVNEALPIDGPSEVRVLVLVPENGEPDEHAWLRSAATNPAFDFLKDQAEDIYSATDGKPFHDTR